MEFPHTREELFEYSLKFAVFEAENKRKRLWKRRGSKKAEKINKLREATAKPYNKGIG